MATKTKTVESVLIEIQVEPEANPGAYRPGHVEVSALSVLQGEALKRVRHALQAGGIQLRNGRFVQTAADAVRYLLERIGEEAGLGNGKHP